MNKRPSMISRKSQPPINKGQGRIRSMLCIHPYLYRYMEIYISVYTYIYIYIYIHIEVSDDCIPG